MMMRLYVIFDRLAFECGPVFEAKNDAVAMRNYDHFMDGTKADPAEFELYCVGSLDRESMSLESCEPFLVPSLRQAKESMHG